MLCLKYSFIFIIALLTVVNCNNVASDNKKQDAKCLLPMEPGPCRMSLTRFYYNAKTNNCEEFKFGGCMGNDNKFGFKQTCEVACKKSGASMTTGAGSMSPSSTTEKNTLVNKQLRSDTLKTLATTAGVTSSTTTTTPQPRLSRTTVKSKSSTTARSLITATQKSNK